MIRKSREYISGPMRNFIFSIFASASHIQDPIAALKEILKQTKDEHGNIMIGIDTSDFKIWRGKLEYLVPTKIFSPFLIPTNPKVINVLLSELKNGVSANFAGNRSTDTAKKLVGDENIFAARDSGVHTKHKIQFKDFLFDYKNNAIKIADIIQNWIRIHFNAENIIDDQSIEFLCSQIMLAFLLDNEAAYNDNLIKAIVSLKNHFIAKSTFKVSIKYLNGYDWAKGILLKEITRLYEVDKISYPKNLVNNKFTMQQAVEHILSLMMVGFDNLQSSLMSVLIRLAQHPESYHQMKKEITLINKTNFIQFDPSILSNKTLSFSQLFFVEALRLTPPVWLQARKNKKERSIIYKNEEGMERSFLLPSATLILIPNFQLARNIENGDQFSPERKKENFILPFSTGPNACPGRNIAYAAAGVLIGEIIAQNIQFSLASNPKVNPQVALKWENLKIKCTVLNKQNSNLAENTQDTNLASRPMLFSTRDYLIISTKSSLLGLAAFLITFSATNNPILATITAELTTLLAWDYLVKQKAGINQDLTRKRASLPHSSLFFSEVQPQRQIEDVSERTNLSSNPA